MASLRDELWAAIDGIYAQILEHPFVKGLTDGSLPPGAFRHYVIQDSHYLRGYARALTVCAAKAPTQDDTRMFAEHASGAIAVEQEMHAEFASALGGSADQAEAKPVAPTTRAYISYLLATCYGGSFSEGLGAVLPCYWIYARVGEALLARSSPDPLYTRWIQTYGGEEYQAIVDAVLNLTDRIGFDLSLVETARMREHFVTTSRYEWMFWDAAWRQEAWPV